MEGLTVVEACVIVCVAGVLLAVFVPTFLKHLRTSKVAEASEQLARMHDGASAYWLARHAGPRGEPLTRCLPDRAGPTPAAPTVDPVDVDFGAEATPGAPTWRALGFASDRPTRYTYSFEPARSGCGVRVATKAVAVVIRAQGDLDGDGVLSTFERRAGISREGELVPLDVLYVSDRTE